MVFVARGDNHECSGQNTILPSPKRRIFQAESKSSVVTFKVKTGISQFDYLKAVTIVLCAYLGLILIFCVLTCLGYKCKKKQFISDTDATDYLPINFESVKLYELKENDIKLNSMLTHGADHTQSSNYFYHISNIALFYGIPVVQLMVSYQKVA